MQTFEIKYDCLILTDEDTEAEKLDSFVQDHAESKWKSFRLFRSKASSHKCSDSLSWIALFHRSEP